jgi:hypothetical protein
MDEIASAPWYERHPNLTAFFAWIVAAIFEIIGVFIIANSHYSIQSDTAGIIFGLVDILLSLAIILAAEIWDLHQKKRSQFNLFFNLVPFGFFIILLLDTKK